MATEDERHEYDGCAADGYLHGNDVKAVRGHLVPVGPPSTTRAYHRQRRHEEPVGVDTAVCTIDNGATERAQQRIVHRSKEFVVQSVGDEDVRGVAHLTFLETIFVCGSRHSPCKGRAEAVTPIEVSLCFFVC